ncbi:hypothetical protein BDN72DRAFT_901433 [Pluteus cervinus]|uniref:Uncharacterized protein n=1 Tax=Pluteus cervinus TaxID=181527 RepID=A0ACD3AH45_9AGAR|nr:hypothetical protein BDN72DRAFT_901433 [Pluteus cervinus]
MNANGNSTTNLNGSAVHNTIVHHNYSSSLPKASQGVAIPGLSGLPTNDLVKVIASNPRARECAVRVAWHSVPHTSRPTCHPDTRQATQASLMPWANDLEASPVRWISGWVGTGTTTIARTMAEIWAHQNHAVASYFFLATGKESFYTSTQLFSFAIACQLQAHFAGLSFEKRIGQSRQISWMDVVNMLKPHLPFSPPIMIIIDGLHECSLEQEQINLLEAIFKSLNQLGTSVKFLISCRPEPHIRDVFWKPQFAEILGSPELYHIPLNSFREDCRDVERFFKSSFNRICQVRWEFSAMSIMDRKWPSEEEISELVQRADGQFSMAGNVVDALNRRHNQDPVQVLDRILALQVPSFKALDDVYLIILERAEAILGDMTSTEPWDNFDARKLCRLMQDLLLYVLYEPIGTNSASVIAEFWFKERYEIGIVLQRLNAVLIQPLNGPIKIRHSSFRDFLTCPSSPHPYSLANLNPVSKFFFFLRKSGRRSVPEWFDRTDDLQRLRGIQLLAYRFRCHIDHWPEPQKNSYDEEARRLHQKYLSSGVRAWEDTAFGHFLSRWGLLNLVVEIPFCGCGCFSQLGDVTEMYRLRTIQPCRWGDCILNEDLVKFCRMETLPVTLFLHEWEEWERAHPVT